MALGKSLTMVSGNTYPSWAFLLTCKMWRWPQLPSSATGRDRGGGHQQAETIFWTHDSLPAHFPRDDYRRHAKEVLSPGPEAEREHGESSPSQPHTFVASS